MKFAHPHYPSRYENTNLKRIFKIENPARLIILLWVIVVYVNYYFNFIASFLAENWQRLAPFIDKIKIMLGG